MTLRASLIVPLAFGLLALPFSAQAQQAGKTWRVGFVGAETPATNQHFLDAFRAGMQAHGYVEGQNLAIDARWGEGRSERFREQSLRLRADQVIQ
jgi:putative ABC transport system substrate-binding protein